MYRICRCCQNKIYGKPVLEYHDMPSMAQNFPDQSGLMMDQGMDLELYQCEHCGLLQISGKPVPYYKDVIRAAAVSEEMKAYRLKYFKDFVDKYGLAGKKIVEIGSGKGEYLKLMQAAGVKAYGIEHEGKAAAVCAEQGLNVTQEFVDEACRCLADSPFDGFFIMNFLEHIPDPNVFLQGICYNMKEGAVGLIEVPNMDMILKNALFSEIIADHLMYFTEKTLRVLIEKNGFEVLECKAVWHDYCLAAIVKKRVPVQLHDFYRRQDSVTRELHNFINMCHAHGKKVAVWGAGHQALAVIALSGIKRKIEFIADSAVFKQNKYTPGTHVPVVEPAEIHKQDIGAVIVMAASYSDEVLAVIRKDYPDVKAAVLRENGLEYISNSLPGSAVL